MSLPRGSASAERPRVYGTNQENNGMKTIQGLNEVCENLGKLVEQLSTDDPVTARAIKRELRTLERAVGRLNRGLDLVQTSIGPQASPPGGVRN
jgi:hypothetical protein